jgi:hypothetical protein
MKNPRNEYVRTKATTIRTNLMEILQALTSQTKDDARVIESLANIFAAHRVKFGQTLAPVRITNGKSARTRRRANIGRRNPAWA